MISRTTFSAIEISAIATFFCNRESSRGPNASRELYVVQAWSRIIILPQELRY